MRYAWVVFLAVLFLTPKVALAGEGHEGLACTGCHSVHDAKGNIIFAVEPNTQALNPRTNQPYAGVTALCLACHDGQTGLGFRPVSSMTSHPYGVAPNPRVAQVPAALLRENELACTSCHDPHPSNANYRYLRVDVGQGGQMQQFCVMCHGAKSLPEPQVRVFTSMDERNPPVAQPPPIFPDTMMAPPAAPPPAPIPQN